MRGAGPMWDETSRFDLFKEVPLLSLPVYFFSGRHDYNTPLQLVAAYYRKLQAPLGKHLVVFEHSTHIPFRKEPQKFYREMLHVQEETWHRK